MVLDAQEHLTTSVEPIAARMIHVERRLMGAAKLGEIREYFFRVDAVALKDAAIGRGAPAQKPLSYFD